ncbi:MAG TPA: hypothetical protein VIK24_09615 [Pyrinomonadaceae bacterium]|jgi:hypothetical protein
MKVLDETLEERLESKLTRVYVALAMSREVAERNVRVNYDDQSSRSIVTLLNVASGMLEEILVNDTVPIEGVSDTIESELLM